MSSESRGLGFLMSLGRETVRDLREIWVDDFEAKKTKNVYIQMAKIAMKLRDYSESQIHIDWQDFKTFVLRKNWKKRTCDQPSRVAYQSYADGIECPFCGKHVGIVSHLVRLPKLSVLKDDLNEEQEDERQAQ